VIAATAGLVAAALGVTVALSGCGAPAVSTVGVVDFERPLAIPPLAPSTIEDGVRVFDLAARAGSTEFRDGVATPTWGFDGDYLGPTLRAARGERIEVRFHNELDEPTTVHWHGMHLPAVMDGGPHQMVDPGATWRPAWTIDQPAATLWYHPHPHGATEEHVRRGLAGMFLLDDTVEQALPIPRDYGVDDIPVIVQDVAFDGEGRIHARDGGFSGALGDELLVNGTLGPYLEVTTDVVRLRLLNASTARIYAFAFADGREFAQIASDGGLLEAPVATTRVQLSPGERAEVLVRMTPGETVVLRSEAPDLGGTIGIFGGSNGGADRFDVLELRAAPALASVGTVPDALVPVERLDLTDAVVERSFELDGTQIDQRKMDMSRIDEVVELDTVEIWSVRNNMAFPHSFHVHDVQFQVLDIGGAPPPPELAGWKDTVYLRPNATTRLVIRFADYADPEHPYMYHCHLLRHEDQGMMGQFLVVEPGTNVPATWTIGTMEGESHDH
jgi:FtsP/CotA-like multicopper oxidase with cupredoxin domain